MKQYFIKIITLLSIFGFTQNTPPPNNELLDFIKDIPITELGESLDELLFSNSNRIETVDKYNSMILNLTMSESDTDNGSYYWNYEGEKYDDGVKGRESVNSQGAPVFFYVNTRVNISSNYITLFVTNSNDPFYAFGNLINYDLEGNMLSGIELYAMESNEPSFNYSSIEKKNYRIYTKARINNDGSVSTLTLADFIVKKKYILDNTGHFKVVKEKVEDFPDNYNDEEIPFLN
ncbi:hypothetical protein SAMN05444411_102260 [Lutibacter oricola]|uniref:Uncharacterized protein n=1 Tax=Lutibacter oricola TaxID=762486 RepID=A0A1H2WQC3_9FLAO|nr:hypothetical protein [Lutibacter oricola]SDW82863.1 hypothetical protein SAMN05444411_102260 [Lutibacter oricola]